MLRKMRATSPKELAQQRKEMRWLWQVIPDWTIKLSVQVNRLTASMSPGKRDEFLWTFVEDAPEGTPETTWFFHFQEVGGLGERVTRNTFGWHRPKLNALRGGIRFHLELEEVKPNEILTDVAILYKPAEDYAQVLIYRCRIQGGFYAVLPPPGK